MNDKFLSSLLRRFVQIILVAALYYLTARLGFLIAMPPGNVTALWPPSGLALAAVLIFGWQSGLGVLAGSFLVNFETMNGTAALPVAAAIAIGSTLQAWVGARAIQHFIKELPPDTIRGTLPTIGIASLTTLLAPAVGVTSLCVAGLAPWKNYAILAWTWWMGDFIGILVFTPSLVVLAKRWRKQKPNEPLLWPLTSFIVGLALFTFFVIGNAEQQQVNNNIQRDTAEMVHVLQDEIDHEVQALVAIGALYDSSSSVRTEEFLSFTTPLLPNSPAVFGFEWAPRVTQAERQVYEQTLRKQGLIDFYIYEKDSQGKNIPAENRKEYFPVTLINPVTANQTALGFDLGSNPARMETIRQARDSGNPAITAPIQLVQGDGNQASVLIMLPVYLHGAPTRNLEERRANLAGLVLGVYRVNSLATHALASINHHDLELYIYDIGNPEKPQFLAFYPSVSGAQSLPSTGAPDLPALESGIYQTATLTTAGRNWQVIVRPGPAYTSHSYGLLAWIALLIGLSVAGSFLAYVNKRQKMEAVARQQGEQLQILYEASQRLNRTLNLDEIYQTICDFMSVIAPNDALVISAFDPGTKTITCRAYWIDSKWLDVSSFPAIPLEEEGKGTQSLVIHSGMPIRIGDYQAYLKSAKTNYYVNGETNEISDDSHEDEDITRSALIVPLKDGDKVTGVIQVMSYRLNAYTDDQLKFLEALALHIVAAEKNARLYAQVQAELNERRQAEDSLREKEAEYRLIADNTADVIWILDIETHRFVYASPSVEKLRGYTPQEVMTQTLDDVLSPSSLTSAQKILAERFDAFIREQRTTTYTDEMEQTRKDGSLVPTEISTTLVKNSAGKVQIVGISRDITDRKRAENALRESEARLSAISDNLASADLFVYAHDQNGRPHYEYISTSIERLMGVSPEDAQRDVNHVRNVILPEYRTQLIQAETQSRENLTRLEMELCLRHGYTGKICWVLLRATPYRQLDGSTHWYGVHIDITDRKKTEENLRNSQASLEKAQSIAHLGSWEMDPATGEYLFWSKELFQLLQRDPDLGVPTWDEFINEIVHPDDRQKRLDAQKQIMETGSPASIEYRIITKQGETRYLKADFQPMRDARKKLIHISGTILDITQIRLSELALRASNERFQQLANNIQEVFWIHDIAAQKITYISPAYERIWGRTCQSLYENPRNYIESILPEDRPAMLSTLEKQAQGAHTETEYRIQQPDGNIRWVWDRSFPIFDENGIPILTTGVVTDITERKQVEEDIQRRQTLLEKVIHLGKNITAITDLPACLHEIHRSIRQELGFDRVGLFLYDTATDIVRGALGTSRDGRPEENDWYEMAIDDWSDWRIALESPNGIVIDDDYHATHNPSEGDEMYGVRQHVTLAAWAGDQPIALITVDNLLSQKQMMAADLEALQLFAGYAGLAIANARLHASLEQRVRERTAELAQSEATYRALFENANDAIFLIQPDGKIMRVNERCAELTGYSAEELIGMDGTQYMSPDEAGRLDRILAGERVMMYERHFIKKDGTPIETEVNLSLIARDDGQPVLIQSMVRDITERKRAQEALRESRDKLSVANAALEKASRMKDEFLASMSHELRTPLTSILGLSESMQLQTFGEVNEKQLRSLKTIESSGRHLLELINDILDLSKIEAGKLDMQFEPCQVADICQSSLQLMKGMAHQKKQNIEFSMKPDSLTMRADARRLKQMLVNLLSNAVKFTPEGGQLGLEVLADEQSKTVSFSIWDKGIGIQPENLEKLFKPFTQLDSRLSRQYSGTGLGLSLVQRMVELHGGSVTVESTPGSGSRFTIILPWSSGTTQPIPQELDSGLLRNALVIEDNDFDAEHAAFHLKELGIGNVAHATANGALEKAALLQPGAILLDLNLPDGSGMELLTRLKAEQRTRAIPVIIVSVEERRQEALGLGAQGYLVKPYTRQDLRNELAKVADFSRPDIPVLVVESKATAPLVMIADDNEEILTMVSDFLMANGLRTVSVRSGFELLERIPELHPDILMVDIQMPRMDGLEVIRQVRTSDDPLVASTPIIAVTALAMTGDREKCLQAGANEYISKPIILMKLLGMVSQFLKAKYHEQPA
jgi:PAS domain S-box-containing protein